MSAAIVPRSASSTRSSTVMSKPTFTPVAEAQSSEMNASPGGSSTVALALLSSTVSTSVCGSDHTSISPSPTFGPMLLMVMSIFSPPVRFVSL